MAVCLQLHRLEEAADAEAEAQKERYHLSMSDRQWQQLLVDPDPEQGEHRIVKNIDELHQGVLV